MDKELTAALEADGFDLGFFGIPDPAEQAEIDAAIHAFPGGHGWLACVFAIPDVRGWRAEIRRGTPAGPDTLCCGYHASVAAAFTACGDTVRHMLEVQRSGDTALAALLRASIQYAAQQRAAG